MELKAKATSHLRKAQFLQYKSIRGICPKSQVDENARVKEMRLLLYIH